MVERGKEKTVDLDCSCLAPEKYSEKDWWVPVGSNSSFFFHSTREGEEYSVRKQNTYQTSTHLADLIRSLKFYRVKTTPVCEGTVYSAQKVKDTFQRLKGVEKTLTVGYRILR